MFERRIEFHKATLELISNELGEHESSIKLINNHIKLVDDILGSEIIGEMEIEKEVYNVNNYVGNELNGMRKLLMKNRN